ncbi:MAG: radical SAM protein [Candidatus Hodarchaeota archaeon]
MSISSDIEQLDYLKELENCKLCEWRCGVDRLAEERGTCGVTLPVVASCQLHPAPPGSYTIFTAGCNFKCLHCQNWEIAHGYAQPKVKVGLQGFVDPKKLADVSIKQLKSPAASWIKADRLFFSGGEPTIHLPYIEELVHQASLLDSNIRVNFDTNGFLTPESFERVLQFSTSITYDIKAYSSEVHRSLTGADNEPVLRNIEVLAKTAPEKLWEFRIVPIPKIIDHKEIQGVCQFIADFSPDLPVSFLAFRPNFVLDSFSGASSRFIDKMVDIAHKCGLKKVTGVGFPNIPGVLPTSVNTFPYRGKYSQKQARLAGEAVFNVGCRTHLRHCGNCGKKLSCPLRSYIPVRTT